jgi:hypothetical protein
MLGLPGLGLCKSPGQVSHTITQHGYLARWCGPCRTKAQNSLGHRTPGNNAWVEVLLSGRLPFPCPGPLSGAGYAFLHCFAIVILGTQVPAILLSGGFFGAYRL